MGQLEIRDSTYSHFCIREIVVHVKFRVFSIDCEIEIEFEIFVGPLFMLNYNKSNCMIVNLQLFYVSLTIRLTIYILFTF
jgi:hypothetical protein